MGFYYELNPNPTTPSEYLEARTPRVFWVLYGILGFALACMAGAALHVLADLAKTGAALDEALYYGFLSLFPGYLLLGLYLALVRKFVRAEKRLEVGARVVGCTVFKRSFNKEKIAGFELINYKPSQNTAVSQHDDSQYYFQGHWRIIARLKNGKTPVIDRHNEKEALAPLWQFLANWLKS